MICGISGKVPSDAVVSPRGHVFERKLIEKVLLEEGKCPVSGEPMSASDLITIQSQAAVRPHDMSTSSIPSMLQAMQSEWDEVMLETFSLKQTLDQTRRELAQALYQHDAACRVIARLMRERDEARAMLSAVGASTTAPPPQPAPPSSSSSTSSYSGDMDVDREKSLDIWSGVTVILSEKMTSLSEERRGRKKTALVGVAPSITVNTPDRKINIGGNSKKAKLTGIQCMAVEPVDQDIGSMAGSKGNLVLTGHSNGTVACTTLVGKNSGFGKIEGAHSGDGVASVAFGSGGSALNRFFSGGEDGVVKIWSGKASPTCIGTLNHHYSRVFCLHPHPVSDYLITMGNDTWACIDVGRGSSIQQAPAAPEGESAVVGAVHPDGLLLTSAGNRSMRIWDIRQSNNDFNPIDCSSFSAGEIVSLAFSENGYHMTAGCGPKVALIDLRKMSILKEFEGPSEVAVGGLAFDYSAQRIAAGWADGSLSILQVKEWGESRLPGGGICCWNGAGAAQQLLTSSGENLNMWN